MSIPYIIINQPDPQNPDQIISYPRAVSNGIVETEEIIKEIEMISTVSGGDILGTIYGLTGATLRKLADGKIVKIEGFGSFRVTFETKALTDGEEAVEAAITKANIVFRPGKRFKQMLKTVSFTKKKAAIR